jgi:hypothetical protein
MIYKDYRRNHVVLPGREEPLKTFLSQEYKGMKHKQENSKSSHSEDALTWSCFDIISQLPFQRKIQALDEILEDSFNNGKNKFTCNFKFKDQQYKENDVVIFIGKKYQGTSIRENTEVDASIETPDKIIFFEAKLYSSIDLVDESKNKTHDQIARKLRVGLDFAKYGNKEFYFIFLDIAPPNVLLQFEKEKSKKKALDKSKGKWKSAWWFNYYKQGRNNSLRPLKDVLKGIDVKSIDEVANNMGWLTWSDLFKIVLRSMIKDH